MIEREIEDGEVIITVNPFPQDIEMFKERALEQNNADQDKGSVAVVLVNGVQIQDKSRLKDGDVLCIGISSYFTLRYLLSLFLFLFPI